MFSAITLECLNRFWIFKRQFHLIFNRQSVGLRIFFVLRVNKNIICPTDSQLKTEWNCRLKIQNRFRHSKVIPENMKFSAFLLFLS